MENQNESGDGRGTQLFLSNRQSVYMERKKKTNPSGRGDAFFNGHNTFLRTNCCFGQIFLNGDKHTDGRTDGYTDGQALL